MHGNPYRNYKAYCCDRTLLRIHIRVVNIQAWLASRKRHHVKNMVTRLPGTTNYNQYLLSLSAAGGQSNWITVPLHCNRSAEYRRFVLESSGSMLIFIFCTVTLALACWVDTWVNDSFESLNWIFPGPNLNFPTRELVIDQWSWCMLVTESSQPLLQISVMKCLWLPVDRSRPSMLFCSPLMPLV